MSDDRETARVLRQAKLLGEDSLNDLDRWRLRHARDEEERAAQRRAEECAPQQRERQTTVDELRAEMADIRAETNRLHDVVLEAVGEVLGEGSNKTCDLIEKAVRDLQREMTASIARHYGELMGGSTLSRRKCARERIRISSLRPSAMMVMRSMICRILIQSCVRRRSTDASLLRSRGGRRPRGLALRRRGRRGRPLLR